MTPMPVAYVAAPPKNWTPALVGAIIGLLVVLAGVVGYLILGGRPATDDGPAIGKTESVSPSVTQTSRPEPSPATESVAIPTASVPGTAYFAYTNPRFGYSFQVPAEFVPGEPLANGSGQTWASVDGTVTVSVQARATPGSAIADQLDEFLAAPASAGWTVTYSVSDQDSATVSGYDAARTGVLYDHVDIGSATTVEFTWHYPTSAAAQVNPWVENSYATIETGDLS